MNKWALIFIFVFFIFYFHAPKKTPLENSIEKAINYLESVKTVNGSWEDMDIFLEIPTSYPKKTVGFADEWVTCYVGYNLKIALNNLEKCGFKTKNYDWNKTLNFVLNTQRSTGGWGYNYKIHSDVDSTAFCGLFLSEFDDYYAEKEKTAEFIIKHQKENGGFPTYLSQQNVYLVKPETLDYEPGNYSWCYPHSSVTASAALFLKKFNSTKYNISIEKASEYLLKTKSEFYWDDFWWNDRLYTTNLVFKVLNISNNDTVNWLNHIQNNDGGWHSGIKNGTSIAFYTALASELSEFETKRGIDWLLQNQNNNGSWEGYKLYRGSSSSDLTPWKEKDYSGQLISDNGIFTTATVLRALSEYYCLNKD